MPLTLDDLVRLPLPGAAAPGWIRLGPDGVVTWLAPGDEGRVQALWALDPATGRRSVIVEAGGRGADEASLPKEEQLRRERLRERGLGITAYAWSERGGTLVVPLAGELFGLVGFRPLVGAPPTPLRRLCDGPVQDPRPSPDGGRIAFVRDGDLHVLELATGEVRALTRGAREAGVVRGLAEYVAQEEMHRHEGFWWSPDGARIAFAEVDDRHVAEVVLGEGTPLAETHRYPFAGAANARVTLHLIPSGGGDPVRCALPPHEYLAWVRFLADGRLVAALQDRRQQHLRLVAVDPDGAARTLLEESSDAWVNLHDGFTALPDGGFLWLSERSGFQHLERVDAAGHRHGLTAGSWMVESVLGVGRGSVWFAGTKDGELQRHVYEYVLSTGALARRTDAPGVHHALVDPVHGRFVDAWSARAHPTRVVLRDRAGGLLHELHRSADPRCDALVPPELHAIAADDGTPLHLAYWRPDEPGPCPLVVIVYGGPHVQRVAEKWDTTLDLRAQWLRERGFAVMKLDNRGSARRGLAFEAAIRHRTGRVEVADQVAGVRWLAARGWIDPARVAITGWSYGGYVTLMALATAPDVFRRGVAGAPVTDWALYDTHYTERYLGLPAENVDGYALSAVATHARGIRDDALMLVHGQLDENVHVTHTTRLADALRALGTRFRLELWPTERHLPRDPAARRAMEERTLGFLTGVG